VGKLADIALWDPAWFEAKAAIDSGRTTLDGDLLAAPAAESVPLSRLYFL
jgi:urease alpha subunit